MEDNDNDKKDLTPEQIEANSKKSEAQVNRWSKQTQEKIDAGGDRASKRYDYKCFEGMRLTSKQKQFVVTFMDPPFLGKRENRHKAYAKVFTASTENSLRANCAATLKKPKIEEAMTAYQVYSLRNHKLEVTTESIENLRRRANYSIDTFYTKDGNCIPLNEIKKEWMICIDNIKKDKKKGDGKDVIEVLEYKLCDRDKASERLQKLLGVYQSMESVQVSVPVNAEKNAIDSAGGKESGGPRIVLNMSVGDQSKKE